MNIVVNKDNFIDVIELIAQHIKQGQTIKIDFYDEIDFKIEENPQKDILDLVEKSKKERLENHVSLTDKYGIGK